MVSQIETACAKLAAIRPLYRIYAVFLLYLISCMKNTFANRPLFWTKTDLRTGDYHVYTTDESFSKTMH